MDPLAFLPRQCDYPGCPGLIDAQDLHPFCASCMGVAHALSALSPPGRAGPFCEICEAFDRDVLVHRFYLARAGLGACAPPGGSATLNPTAQTFRPQTARTVGQGAALPFGATSDRQRASHGQDGAFLQETPPAVQPTAASSTVTGAGGSGVVTAKKVTKKANLPPVAFSPTGAVPKKKRSDVIVGDVPLDVSISKTVQSFRRESDLSSCQSEGSGSEYSEDEDEEEEDMAEDDGSRLTVTVSNTPGAPARQLDASGTTQSSSGSTAPPPASQAGRAGSEDVDSATEMLDHLTVYMRAIARVGEEMPPPLPSDEAEDDDEMPGQEPSTPAPYVLSRLPLVKGFTKALHSSWKTHKDPKKLPFMLDVVGGAEAGMSTCPNLDNLLAQSFLGSVRPQYREVGTAKSGPIAGPVGTNPAGFTVLEDKMQSDRARNAYRSAALAAKDINLNQLLLASTKDLVKGLPTGEHTAELNTLFDIMLKVNWHAVKWMGRAMDYNLQSERARWLDYVDLEPKREGEKPLGPRGEMYKSLINMENSPTTLMGGGLELLQGRVTFYKAAKDIVESTTVPQEEPQQARRSRSSRTQDRRRSASFKKHSSSSRGASAARAPDRPRSKVVVPERAQQRRPSKEGRQPSSYRGGRGRGQRK